MKKNDTPNENKEKTIYQAVSPFLAGAIISWFCYMSLATGMYTYKLAEFYGVEYDISQHGIALNGRTGFGNQIAITELTVTPLPGGGQVKEWCPNVTSKRGFVTISTVGDETTVCCLASNRNQWTVPYKDVGEERHYLCGEWPLLDHVVQPKKNSSLIF